MSICDYDGLITYSVYETTHDGIVLTSQFFNRADVNDYIDRFTSSSSTVHVYRTSCLEVFHPHSQPKFNSTGFQPQHSPQPSPSPPPEINSTDFQPLPSPPPEINSTDFQHPPTPPPEFNTERKVSFEEYEVLDNSRGETPEFVLPFTDMVIRKYGKGYVLIPPLGYVCGDNKRINKNRGTWNKNVNGWFFQKRFLNSFVENGAIKEI